MTERTRCPTLRFNRRLGDRHFDSTTDYRQPISLSGLSANESLENDDHDNGRHSRSTPCVVPHDAIRSGNDTDYPKEDEQRYENLPKPAIVFF